MQSPSTVSAQQTGAAVAREGRGAASPGAPVYRLARKDSDDLMNKMCDGWSTRLGSETDFLRIWLWFLKIVSIKYMCACVRACARMHARTHTHTHTHKCLGEGLDCPRAPLGCCVPAFQPSSTRGLSLWAGGTREPPGDPCTHVLSQEGPWRGHKPW